MKIPGSVVGLLPIDPVPVVPSYVQPPPASGWRSGAPSSQIFLTTISVKSQEMKVLGPKPETSDVPSVCSKATDLMMGGSPNSRRSGAVSWVLLHDRAVSTAAERMAERMVLDVICWKPPGRRRRGSRREPALGGAGGPEGQQISDLARKGTAN